jgi:hypothetical protein
VSAILWQAFLNALLPLRVADVSAWLPLVLRHLARNADGKRRQIDAFLSELRAAAPEAV